MKNFNLKPKQKLTNTIVIDTELDTNDGDYTTESANLTVAEFKHLLPVITAISKGIYNSIGDCKKDDYIVPAELAEEAWDIVPSSEHGGHSLCITELVYWNANGNQFDIEL